LSLAWACAPPALHSFPTRRSSDLAFLGREDAGIFYGDSGGQLLTQLVMILIIAAWVAVTTGALFAILKATIGLRVSAEEEIEGQDRKSTRLNSSHVKISYAVFCLK